MKTTFEDYYYDLVDRDIIISLSKKAESIYGNHKFDNHPNKRKGKPVSDEERIKNWFYGLAGQYCTEQMYKQMGYTILENSIENTNAPDEFDIRFSHPDIPGKIFTNEIKTQELRLLVDPFKNEPIDAIPTSLDVNKRQIKRYLKHDINYISLVGVEKKYGVKRGYRFHLLGYITPKELSQLKPRTKFGNRVVNHHNNNIINCCYVDSPEFTWYGGIERKKQLIEKKVKWLPLNLEP